jgi:MoxR-like ATPase
MPNKLTSLIKLTLEQIERAGLICMAADIPFAVWGGVGIGKTATIKRIARKTRRRLYIMRVSDKLPQDLGGTPMPVIPEGNVASSYLKYLMASDLIPFVTPDRQDEQSMLFFDEIDRTDNQDTQNTAFQFLDGDGVDGAGRGVNGNMLVAGCRIAVAGNGGTDQYTTKTASHP